VEEGRRCPYCNPSLPKTHTDFWIRKFERNNERDSLKINALKAEGWRVLVFWECEIKKDAIECAIKVKSSLEELPSAVGMHLSRASLREGNSS
jgi:DNA mismatch endonuclease (patch repair protein)